MIGNTKLSNFFEMKVGEVVKIEGKMMELLSKNDIKTEDYKYIGLFEEYSDMKQEGLKVTYIVAVLSEKYKIGKASVYRVLKRFCSTIKT